MPSPFTFDKTKPADADALNQGAAQIRTDKTTLANVLGTLQAFGAPTTGWRNTQIGNDMYLSSNATYTGAVWNRDDIAVASWLIVKQVAGSFLIQYAAAAANPITWTTPFTLTSAGALTIAGGLTISGALLGATGFPPTITIKKGSQTGTNYTTSSTTYVDIDNANLGFTVTIPVGMKLTIRAFLQSGSSSQGQGFMRLLDGTTTIAEGRGGTDVSAGGTGDGYFLTAVIVGDGLSHTIKPQWASLGGTGPSLVNNAPSTTTTPSSGWPVIEYRLEQAN